MYLAISALLQISYLVSSSPLHGLASGPVSQLYKRDWIPECDDRPWIWLRLRGERGRELDRSFRSVFELCTGYPHDVGLFCNANGDTEQLQPRSMISRVYGNSFEFCTRLCHCENYAPDLPSQEEEAPRAPIGRIADCTTSSDDETIGNVDEQPSSSSTCPYPRPTVRANADDSGCNEYWYGRPDNQDCQQAMLGLPDHGTTERRFREVLPMGITSQWTSSTWPPIRTPLILTHGHCVVAVSLVPPPSQHTRTMAVETLGLNGKAEYLHRKCVQGEGIGGWLTIKQIMPPLSSYIPLLSISLFAPDSKQKEFLDLRYHCMVDDSGSVKCKPPLPVPISTIQHGKQDGTAVPKGSKQACSGSCNNPTDCDINSDCICTAPDIGISLSSSWDRHSCRYIAGAAAAIVTAAIAPKRCHGRCLLFEDGTLAIDKPTDVSNATQLSPDVSIPDYPGSSKDNSTASLSNNMANLKTDRIPTIFSNSEYPPYKNASDSPFEYATFNESHPARTPAILYCPCNCTYVSAGCCLSPTVYEDPSMQIYMDPLSADSSICCDPNSGLWLPKPSEKCSRHRSSLNGTDFIGFGSARWNRSATLPLGDYNSEDNSR